MLHLCLQLFFPADATLTALDSISASVHTIRGVFVGTVVHTSAQPPSSVVPACSLRPMVMTVRGVTAVTGGSGRHQSWRTRGWSGRGPWAEVRPVSRVAGCCEMVFVDGVAAAAGCPAMHNNATRTWLNAFAGSCCCPSCDTRH